MKKMISFLLLTTVLTGVISCGSKNKVNSNQLGNTWAGGSSALSYNPTTINALNLYANKFQCQRRPSVVYNIQTGYNANTVGGQFQIGPLSGDAGTSYVGVSGFKDIIVVTKVLRGGSPIGFNIEVSYCAVAYSQNGQLVTPPYFADRQISAFAAQSGITLYEKITQGVGSLAAQQTLAYVAPYQGTCQSQYGSSQCTYQAFNLYTSFGDASYSLTY